MNFAVTPMRKPRQEIFDTILQRFLTASRANNWVRKSQLALLQPSHDQDRPFLQCLPLIALVVTCSPLYFQHLLMRHPLQRRRL